MASQQQYECLFQAIRDRNELAIRLLINLHSLNINDNSQYDEYFGTALHVATTTNDVSMVKLIVALGGDVHATDYYGATPLYQAILEKRSVDVVQVLLEHGSDIYKKVEGCDDLDTPITLAIHGRYARRYTNILMPFTKGHAKWKKLRIIARIIGTLILYHRASIENVWSPGGTGFELAKAHFNNLIHA